MRLHRDRLAIRAARWRLALALLAVAIALPAAAQQSEPAPLPPDHVTLTAPDDSFRLAGRIIAFDGETARIQTDAGALTVAYPGLSCAGPGCPGPGPFRPLLRISGAVRMSEVLFPALIERYALAFGYGLEREAGAEGRTTYRLTRPDGGMQLTLTPQDEAEALAAQASGETDLVLALAEPDDIPGTRLRVLALDALVPAVARSNPLTSITMEDLRGVLSGRLTDWSQLGVQGRGPILFLGSQAPEPGVANLPMPPAAPGADGGIGGRALADEVMVQPAGFALLRASNLHLARPLAVRGPCGRPIEANDTRLKAEDYPLPAPLLLVLPDRRLPRAARDFIDFLDSPAAQLVVRRAGFINQTPERIPLTAQGQRLANAISAAGQPGAAELADLQRLVTGLRGSDRLTPTFRFRNGGAELDAQSQGNIDRLARLLASGRITGQEMIFAGFGDGTGPAGPNRRLSEQRAEAVRNAVAEALQTLRPGPAPLQLTAQGHGETLPMGCDDSTWGRQVNRRVEVWIR